MSALTRPEATNVVRRLVAFYGQALGRRWMKKPRRQGYPERRFTRRRVTYPEPQDYRKAPDEDDVQDWGDDQDLNASSNVEEVPVPHDVTEILHDEGLRSIVRKHRQTGGSEVDVGPTVLDPVTLRVEVLAHLRKTYDVLFPSNIVPITRTVEEAATFVLEKLRPPKNLLARVKESAPPNLKIKMSENWRAGTGTKVDIPRHLPKTRVR